jgi:plastocyanin
MRAGKACLIVLLAVLVAGALVATACGSSKESATPTPQTKQPAATTAATEAPTTEAAATTTAATSTPETAAGTAEPAARFTTVTIKDFEFDPATVTVKLGDDVMWTNDGPSIHTVTADDGSFDSGDLDAGKTYVHTFTMLGTFDYHCSIHPFMKGQVVVEE